MMHAVHVESLGLSRGDRILFEGLSFSMAAGEATALTGANGAGKTSLLRAMAGLIRPSAGRVRFEGAGESPEEAIHLLGHQDGLKSGRSAREELDFQAEWCGAQARGMAAAAEALGLGRLLDLEVRKLSAGQRRRLALARLIAAPRALWLLDEPLSPLDAQYRARFTALMAAHLQGGGMILAAVHDPLGIASRAVELGA